MEHLGLVNPPLMMSFGTILTDSTYQISWELLSSGNLLQFAIKNGQVEIVICPIKTGDCPSFCVRLPAGKWVLSIW